MDQSSERRATKRIAIRLPVVYHGPDGKRREGTTENVSRGGMLLVAQGPAPAGSRLRVAITGSDGRERQLVADVVRSTPEGRVAVSVAESDSALMEELLAGPVVADEETGAR